MAIVKAGGVATLLNGWWEPGEMEHAIHLTEPKLIIADAPRAKRIAERCAGRDIVSLPIDLPVEQALADLLGDADDGRTSRDRARGRCDDPLHLGLDRPVQGRAVDPSRGRHRHLHLCDRADRPARPADPGRPRARDAARTLLSVPLFHVTGEVPVMLNSFVIGRCMVIMPKWDAPRRCG